MCKARALPLNYAPGKHSSTRKISYSAVINLRSFLINVKRMSNLEHSEYVIPGEANVSRAGSSKASLSFLVSHV